MKRKLIIFLVFAVYIFSTILFIVAVNNIIKYGSISTVTNVRIADENGMKLISKVEGKDFYIFTNGNWEKRFLKGVNIGAGKPGSFPGQLGITKDEYLRWFKQISDMNADVIRVYTTLSPTFYDALLIYNKTNKKPLYLMQGVWVSEENIEHINDAYGDNEIIIKEFIKDGQDLVDIFHGNASLPEKKGFASGEYKSDVSKYVVGWILGIDWDANFVENTNKLNLNKNVYSGKYLFTEKASPFEAFMCEVGDKIVEYEVEKYKMARPVSFANWPTTDMLDHPNEPLKDEDKVVVNVEHIKPQENFKQGVFATYHIYPYYPDFMHYQHEYAAFVDDDGNINTYKAYLRDLIKEHTMPVMVAEFGIPASRGMAHESLYLGYHQGKHDEAEQGYILQNLLKDIYDEGYSGAIVFAWQDEWFKKTWNTVDLDLPYARPFWSNPQTNEQHFGLLAFDPGEKKSICYVDGDVKEWRGEKAILEGNGIKLFAKADEKYLYLMLDVINFDFTKDKLLIPIDTIDGQGNKEDKERKVRFTRAADFEILIDGKDNSKILVDAYYDSFYYVYNQYLDIEEQNPFYKTKNSGVFNPMYLGLSKGMTLPQDNITLPFTKYETGMLQFGNANPNKNGYSSLADFCEKDGKIEIKIPWQLLNVMDPSTKSVMADLYKYKEIKDQKVEGFYIGAGILKENDSVIDMSFYTWESWEMPTYHERLKPSYYSMQEAFGSISH